MEALLQQIEQYKQEIQNTPVNGAESLEVYRIRFLGTKGIVKNLFTEMRNVPADRKTSAPGKDFDRTVLCVLHFLSQKRTGCCSG